MVPGTLNGFWDFYNYPNVGVSLEAVKSIKFYSDTGGHFIFLGGLLHFSKDPPFCLCTTSRIVAVRLGKEINL